MVSLWLLRAASEEKRTIKQCLKTSCSLSLTVSEVYKVKAQRGSWRMCYVCLQNPLGITLTLLIFMPEVYVEIKLLCPKRQISPVSFLPNLDSIGAEEQPSQTQPLSPASWT